jgi:hypothetical protein
MTEDPRAKAQADLIYAILTMDSYNRGYGFGINQLADTIGTRVGNYSISVRTDSVADSTTNPAFAAGFYALAYRNATTGETVVSYRGTDVKGIFASDSMGGSDVTNGYGIAVGLPGHGYFNAANLLDVHATQAVFAEDFYRSVANNTSDSIILTGHSLGGGLAGYVSGFTESHAVVFDNMPFGIAANARAAELGINGRNQSRGYYTEQEFLVGVRNGGIQGLLASYGLGNILGINGQFVDGVALGRDTAALELNNVKTGIDSHAGFDRLGSHFSQYHSMALLTSLLWNKAYGDDRWVPAGHLLWSSFFDEAVASAVPNAKERTTSDGSILSTMEAAIAYSALPIGEGERPFGDTGIWSMFDDAGDLGRVLAGDEPSFFNETVAVRPAGWISAAPYLVRVEANASEGVRFCCPTDNHMGYPGQNERFNKPQRDHARSFSPRAIGAPNGRLAMARDGFACGIGLGRRGQRSLPELARACRSGSDRRRCERRRRVMPESTAIYSEINCKAAA